MSTYTAFIYENHNLQEHKPEWMRAERYEYCEQVKSLTSIRKGFIKTLTDRIKSHN